MLLKATASATRTRRKMILLSLPVVLLALFIAWKLISMPLAAQRSIDAYDQGNFDRSIEASDSLMFLNVAEPWIPYFNRGTAYATGQAYSDATDDLAKALEVAPQERRCEVRVNLALAWELQGDSYFEAGYFAGAIQLYETAKAVLDAGADEGCFERQPPEEQQNQDQQPDPQQPQDDSAERLQQADERVTEKLRQSEQQDAPEQQGTDAGQPEDANDGGGGKVDDLQERSDEAEKEKQNQDSSQRGENRTRDYVEKPW